MSGPITFTLDGESVTAEPGETLFQVAKRQGKTLPHMCSGLNQHYRADGNCRLCVVEVEGERTLAASCIRTPAPGMTVHTGSDRVRQARSTLMELLVADQPARADHPDPGSRFWALADEMRVSESRYPSAPGPVIDTSHPAIRVDLAACIHCTNCVRACREVQVNDVIGMAGHGAHTRIVFDQGDALGTSTCVGCGECVQACPTGALLPAAETALAAADRAVASVCPYCGVGCQLEFRVKDERIVAVEGRDGPGNANRLCVKGRFGFDYVASPDRLTTPLIRKPGIPREAVADLDPANPLSHFRTATWDEALDVAAAGLKAILDRDGPSAMAGFGSAKGSNEEAYLFQKLVRTGFGTNNVDHCTRLCHASSVAALMETIGSGAVTAPFTDALQADLIMVIGCNPSVNHPVAASFFKNAAQAGKTLVVVDPRGQSLDRYATHRIQHRPGSDVALLNAMLHTIVSEDLIDRDYIAEHTEGYQALADSLAPFAPEAMADVCGVDPDTIRTVARAYATAERSLIFWGMGMSQHVHGTDNCRTLISLALMCGQIGRPGTGLHPLRGQNNVQGASDAGLIPIVFPDYKACDDPEHIARFEEFWGAKLDRKKGLTVVEIADAAYRGQVKGLYVMGENPLMSDPNQNHTRAAFANLEHLVVQDIFMTETASYADVVLPASAWPEKDGTVTNSNRQVQMGRAAIAPPGDARQDWWIIQEIARRIGLDWNYTHPSNVFAEMRGCMASIKGITWDRLQRENAVTYPCDDEAKPGKAVLFGDRFPTASGRGKFVPTELVPPDERPDTDYPLVLTTGRILEHWHTGAMTRRTEVLDALEPEAVICVSQGDLDELGLAAGAAVTVSSRRGSITAKARVDGAVPRGVVFVPFCFNEAAANLLTNQALDPFGKIPEVKFCAVRLAAA